eukprot:g29967.t1
MDFQLLLTIHIMRRREPSDDTSSIAGSEFQMNSHVGDRNGLDISHGSHSFDTKGEDRPTKRCIALYDYTPSGDNEEHQIAFKKGDVIWIIEEEDDEDDGWMTGRLQDSELEGFFPKDFVRLIQDE